MQLTEFDTNLVDLFASLGRDGGSCWVRADRNQIQSGNGQFCTKKAAQDSLTILASWTL